MVSVAKSEDQLELAIDAFRGGDLDSAESILEEMLGVEPEHASGLQLKGAIFFRRGDLESAISCFRHALAINDVNPEGWFQLGQLCELTANNAEAKTCYVNCLQIVPTHVECLNNLGNLELGDGEITAAIGHLVEAATLEPNAAFHFANLGNAYTDIGAHREAIQCYTQALELDPTLFRVYSNLLLCLNYDLLVSPQEVFEAHRQYGVRLSRQRVPLVKRDVKKSGKMLRVGYVSSDFRQHPVADFLEPLLRGHDRSQFEIYCYANNAVQDSVTERFQNLSTTWRQIDQLDDEQAALVIHADEIDILVDLGGHTVNDRLGIFAYKPASIQITWLGYPNTTGLSQIDYRISDEIADPTGTTDSLHTETLIRLEHGFLCYRGDDSLPLVEHPPCVQNGFITFGSFNNLAKINAATLALWSEVLKAVPFSKLVLKAKHFKDPEFKQEFIDRFTRLGISKTRLILLPATPSFEEHMALYNQIDIALDTFPYNGTTTTFEALWMGVPVVSLCGETHVSRVGASILEQLKFGDWVTNTEQGYVSTAVSLAKQQTELAVLRTSLRQVLKSSTLTDHIAFAQKMEKAFAGIAQYKQSNHNS